LNKEKGGLLERMSFLAIISAIITGLALYFGLPEYVFNTRPNLVSSLGSNTMSFIEGAISATITVVLVLKLYSHITRNKDELHFNSKAIRFEEIVTVNETRSLFVINGKGSFQRMEIQAEGNPKSRMLLEIDGSVHWDESFEELSSKSSRFLRAYRRPSPQSKASCSVEFDLPKNFCEKLSFSIKNVDATLNLTIKGTAHYSIC